ncbi:putative nuclease HARBI1 [Merluccius polli]|uniref:Nuclease HARBI1 n=1 Tax=Merluccius polli TaxID=89951 RepID=A0AA47P4U7_MERPO|nr:putative nuclease HARBI1 [Merluccius polli]
MELCRDLQPMLERETQRTKAIPVHIQLLSTLGLLATGTFQRETGDICGISQPTLSRIMPAVLDAFISLAPIYIQFPKGLHSINTQIICNANTSLLNVVARWPGGTHDSFILQNSSVGVHLQAGAVEDGWLIGDRGYPLKPWLMTPVANPRTPQEQHYNRVHARSRSVVERAIGLLKGRWLCLSSAGGALQYKPEKVCHIILACCVLHNLAIRHGFPLQESPRADEPMPNAEHFPLPNAAAIQTREDTETLGKSAC